MRCYKCEKEKRYIKPLRPLCVKCERESSIWVGAPGMFLDPAHPISNWARGLVKEMEQRQVEEGHD